MADVEYDYSIQNAFPNHVVSLDRLKQEIQTSTIVTALGTNNITTNGDTCAIWFRATLSTGDKTTLDAIVAAHSGTALPQNIPQTVQLCTPGNVAVPLTTDNRLRFSSEKTNTSKTNFFTHNLCDTTTWYTNSTRVVGETATDTGAHLSYTLAHSPVVDVYHGKISQEDYLLDAAGNKYRVIVNVNGVAKVERDPHFAAIGGGPAWDYTINYTTGTITFQTALLATDVVTVTYYWVNLALGNGTASRFRLVPGTGKKLTVDSAKCQFTADVDLQDTVMFQVMGWVDVFAPQLLIANGGPYPSHTQIPIQYFPYKTMYDFNEDAHIPGISVGAIGATSNWRSGKALNVYRWDYVAGSVAHSASGMEIWIFLTHDRPIVGSRATATLYCISENEP